jgi:hypothetical protein
MELRFNAAAVELLNLNAARALRFDALERKRQNAINLKIRPLSSQVKTDFQAIIKRREVSESFTETTVNISRELLNALGVTSVQKGKFVLKFFGAGFYELLPIPVSEIQVGDAIVTVR